MIRAILGGSKSQTRRVIRPQPNEAWETPPISVEDGRYVSNGCVSDMKCPFGKPGDRLWVRETFGVHKPGSLTKEDLPLFEYEEPDSDGSEEDRTTAAIEGRMRIGEGYDLLYRATKNIDPDFPLYWRPSIHMPRWASRIALEVVSVRVERVGEISRSDAEHEGVEKEWDGTAYWYKNYLGGRSMFKQNPVNSFGTLWDSINAKRGFGWDVNPYVWMIEFKVI